MPDSTSAIVSAPVATPTEPAPAPTVWRTTGLPIVVGIVAFGVSILLREAGALVGIVACALAGLCFVLAPGPRGFSDRFFLLAALCIGWLPLIGWLPGIELKLDVPGVLLAVAVGVVCGCQIRPRSAGSRTVARPSVAEGIAMGFGVLTSLWWARPFARMSDSGILAALQHTGYDNVSHFSMYKENLQLGSFVETRPTLANGATRLGSDYPQGMHQGWAQFIRLLHPHPPTTVTWLLHSYLDLLVLTVGVTVALACMAVIRLCRRDVLVAVPAMAVVVALFGIGRFGPLNGTANFELAVVAVAVAVLLMVRPTLHPAWNFFAVAGMGLIAAYNWYPLIVMMVPALVVATIRAVRENSGRTRLLMTGAAALTVVAYALPLATFAHRGASWLNLSGGGFASPWGLLIVTIVALVLVAAIRQATAPDLMTNVIVGAPSVLGAGAVVLVAAYEVHSTGIVPYYGQKLATAVLGVCSTVLVGVLAQHLANAPLRRKLSTPVAVVLATLLTIGVIQVDGYVGPVPGTLQSLYNASGVDLRNLLYQQPSTSPVSQRLLLAAQQANGRPGNWWFLDPNPPPGITFVLMSQWFSALQGDPTNQNGLQPFVPFQLDGSLTANQIAHIVIEDFPNPAANGVHLFVSPSIEHAIVRQDPAWGSSGRLYVMPTA